MTRYISNNNSIIKETFAEPSKNCTKTLLNLITLFLFPPSKKAYGLMAVNALKKPTNEGVNNKLFGSSIFEHE